MPQEIVAVSKKRPPTVLQDEQIKALIGKCSNRAPTGIRNRAMLAVLWRCGLRIAEALALAPSDIDLAGEVLSVRHGKGDKARKLGIDAGTAALLARWIDTRARLGLNKRGRPLFCTLKGGAIDQSYVRHLLIRLAGKADLEHAHPHAMRHSYAAGLAREGTAINVIRDALGHSSLATTDRYLRGVAPVHVIDTMRQREWEL
jgi:integrase/recombinase XerC